jgi:hypothetical protein
MLEDECHLAPYALGLVVLAVSSRLAMAGSQVLALAQSINRAIFSRIDEINDWIANKQASPVHLAWYVGGSVPIGAIEVIRYCVKLTALLLRIIIWIFVGIKFGQPTGENVGVRIEMGTLMHDRSTLVFDDAPYDWNFLSTFRMLVRDETDECCSKLVETAEMMESRAQFALGVSFAMLIFGIQTFLQLFTFSFIEHLNIQRVGIDSTWWLLIAVSSGLISIGLRYSANTMRRLETAATYAIAVKLRTDE